MFSEKQLIFIISLPRSGSTLLQRLLTSNDAFDSCAETWMLLPLFYATSMYSVFAEYGHTNAVKGIREFIDLLPDKELTFHQSIKELYLDLIGKVSPSNDIYFIEKTPRNALIIDDLLETFKESKFIFLWRHPGAIVSSIIDTWGGGRWNVYKY